MTSAFHVIFRVNCIHKQETPDNVEIIYKYLLERHEHYKCRANKQIFSVYSIQKHTFECDKKTFSLVEYNTP